MGLLSGLEKLIGNLPHDAARAVNNVAVPMLGHGLMQEGNRTPNANVQYPVTEYKEYKAPMMGQPSPGLTAYNRNVGTYNALNEKNYNEQWPLSVGMSQAPGISVQPRGFNQLMQGSSMQPMMPVDPNEGRISYGTMQGVGNPDEPSFNQGSFVAPQNARKSALLRLIGQ